MRRGVPTNVPQPCPMRQDTLELEEGYTWWVALFFDGSSTANVAVLFVEPFLRLLQRPFGRTVNAPPTRTDVRRAACRTTKDQRLSPTQHPTGGPSCCR